MDNNKQVINVFQLSRENNREVMDYYKAVYYSTPPMRAITGVKFPDNTVCKYGEWAIQYSDESFVVITNEQFQKLFVSSQPQSDNKSDEKPSYAELVKSDKSFPEDYTLENGNYENKCTVCGSHFIGYKRRTVCKICNTLEIKVSKIYYVLLDAAELLLRAYNSSSVDKDFDSDYAKWKIEFLAASNKEALINSFKLK